MPQSLPPFVDARIDTDADHMEAALKVSDGGGDVMVSNTELRARILRKLDWHVLPLVSLLYFLSFLDRTNIANARIAGMATDLKLVGLRYNTAAAIFFVPYCLGQVPSNVILKLFRPSRWIPFIMVVWGLVMTLMCLVKTYHQLLVARAFLGLAEAGLFPGVTYYLSSWYPRAEMAKRMAIFLSAATLAGAFGGLFAYFIEKMEGIGGLHGWQWIFCLEGLATVLVALAAPFLMHDSPETASFLTENERHYIGGLMKIDSQGLATHYDPSFILQSIKDYKTYVQFGIFIGMVIPGYAFALFIPTIIHELGFSAANAQLLSVPPYAAGCISVIIIGTYSDRRRLRGPFVVGAASVAFVGVLVLYTQAKAGVALVGVVLSALGVFPGYAVSLAWASSNAGGDLKRAVTIAMVTGLGNLGGICSSYIFFDPPRFHVGLGISMGVLSCSILLSLFATWKYRMINQEKERFCRERGITDDHKDEFTEKGDDSPLFRYSI